MKKLIICGLILIILIIACIIPIKGLKLFGFSIKSFKEIKQTSQNLDKDLTTASKLVVKTYPEIEEKLKNSINNFKSLKEEYGNKVEYNKQVNPIILSEIEKYEIEFLWTIIGNYATKEGITLTLDIVEGAASEIYNLNFKLTGSYVGMTDFIYDIENDERLNFKIEDLKMELIKVAVAKDGTTSPINTNTNTTTETAKKTTATTVAKQTTIEILQNTFSVKNISINLKK